MLVKRNVSIFFKIFKECQVTWMENWSEGTMIKLPMLLLTKEARVEGSSIGKDHKKDDSTKKKRHISGGEFIH